MHKTNIAIAEAYYAAMAKEDAFGMESCLHPDVQFIGPLAEMTGKEAVLEAAKKFAAFFKTLTIRARFGSGDQVMLAYDFEFPAPIGKFSAAVLMTFQGGLIAKFELFYDARPFEQKKDRIFS